MHPYRVRYFALFVLSVVVAGVIATGVAAAASRHTTNRLAPALLVVAAHAGSLDTGSGSATRQGYTIFGPAKPGNSGSLNAARASHH